MIAFTQDEGFVNLELAREIVVKTREDSVEIVASFPDGRHVVLGSIHRGGRTSNTIAKLNTQIKRALAAGQSLDVPALIAQSQENPNTSSPRSGTARRRS